MKPIKTLVHPRALGSRFAGSLLRASAPASSCRRQERWARRGSRQKQERGGAALIISMIFVLIFSALTVSMATISDTNLQIAENQHKADGARACAESGLEIMRFWLSQVSIPGTSDSTLAAIQSSLQSQLQANCISNISPTYNSSTINIPSVTLNAGQGQNFSATIAICPDDAEKLQVDVTGVYGSITRTIRVNYEFGTRKHPVFDFGVATRGPLSLTGNIELEGVNVPDEANVYIESENSNLALIIIGNSTIAGDAKIANPLATVVLQGGQISIGGESGQAALDHVSIGVDSLEFPAPDPSCFEHYVINTIDSSTDTTNATFENVRIVAGTNPSFSGNTTLNGIVFIETPNVVTFTGNTTVTGIIVGDGDLEDDSGTNRINFLGTVDSYPVGDLPDEEQFQELKNETGTFILAPGFGLSFGGNFTTLNGVIAGNRIQFFGNAGGTLNGSIINYSDEIMPFIGNNNLFFNHSGTTQAPHGFTPQKILQYIPTSYSEIVL